MEPDMLANRADRVQDVINYNLNKVRFLDTLSARDINGCLMIMTELTLQYFKEIS